MGLANLLLKGAGKLAPAARKGTQLASKIKVAKASKVASTIRKTCLKGKNCSATCIAASKICLVSLSPRVTDASNKMAKFLKSSPTSAAPVKKAPAASAAPKSSGIANTQKNTDDQILERLKAQRDEYTKRWVEAARKGNKEEAEKALAGRNLMSKEYDDFKKAYDAASAAPVKKAPATSAAPKSSGIANTQKIADDQKLERLTAQWEESKDRWNATIGKGNLETTKKAADVWKTAEKEYKDFKKAYDDIYNRPVLKSPKELMAEESKTVRDRVQSRINEGFYGNTPKETVARVTAEREKTYRNFKKLSDDQLAALGLYGRNRPKYYLDVNKFLRTGSMEGMTPETQQMVQNIVSNMNSALAKLPASLETNLARAVSGPGAKNLQNLKVGDIIEDKGFGSYTTADKPSTLDQFLRQGEDNAIMEVTSRNARDVSPIMEYQSEAEHILQPGTKLRVTGIGGSTFSRKVGSVPTYLFEEI